MADLPISSIWQVYGSNALAHERLAIIDPDSGSQPLVSPDGKGKLQTWIAVSPEVALGAPHIQT
jgi:asparagine synthetase B (glutamine-hydrolysing)